AGDVAFELYDTYGFPLDLIQVIGRENNFVVDENDFERHLALARERSAGSKVGEAAVDAVYKQVALAFPTESRFIGYKVDDQGNQIERALASLECIIRDDGQLPGRLEVGKRAELVTNKTPFYPESGGQVGDRGEIRAFSGGKIVARFIVEDTVRPV